MNSKLLSLIIKLILILSIITAISNHLWHIASTNLFLLALTFAPQIIKSQTKIKFPKELEIILLIFVLFTLTLGKIKGIVAPIAFGIGTGVIALFILYILYSTGKIKKNYSLIILFSFCFGTTFGVALEIGKYLMKLILNHPIHSGIYLTTINNLIYVSIGAGVASTLGYIYMKTHFSLITRLLKKIKKSNKDIFKNINSIEDVIQEIKQGESETQEFKSTLRTNLHTNEKDKKIEHNALKTITAFLNSKGGILYIGITDEGKVLGLEKDIFPNPDRFLLHLTNLIKQKIGKSALRLTSIDLIKIKDRHIARIECKKSKTPNFITEGKEEYFYIRIGPQTQRLQGSELILYTSKKFKK